MWIIDNSKDGKRYMCHNITPEYSGCSLEDYEMEQMTGDEICEHCVKTNCSYIDWPGKPTGLKVYTSRISYSGQGKLDISVKSGDKVFAPTWDMVMGYKNGKLTVKQYTDMYYDLMRKSWRENRERWMQILNADTVVLCCYCAAGEFCHRHLLADMFVKSGKTLGIPVTYGGEI
jgi:uncharacterized protein YeaO (DUF488 family)